MVTQKRKNKSINHQVSNSKCSFLFFNFELVTQSKRNNSLIFELVPRREIFIVQLRFSNSKVEK